MDGRAVLPQHRDVTLGPDGFAVTRARHFTVALCLQWGLDDLVDAASSVVTELVTNAVVHTHDAKNLRLTVLADRLRIEVSDHADGQLPRSPASVDAVRGRGLTVVEALADAWGVTPEPGGKTVWAELGRTETAGAS